MKNCSGLLLLVLILISQQILFGGQESEEQKRIALLRIESKKTGKPILLLALDPHELLCQRLEKEVFGGFDTSSKLKEFLTMKVDPGSCPEFKEKYHLDTFPICMALSEKDEMIFRWEGYCGPTQFLIFLNESLRRFDIRNKGLDWELPPLRAESPILNADHKTIPAPTDNPIVSLCIQSTFLWCLDSLGVLYQLNPETGEVLSQSNMSRREVRYSAICGMGDFICLLPEEWTRGQSIQKFSTAVLNLKEEIKPDSKSKSEQPASALGFYKNELWVAEQGGRVSSFAPATGKFGERIQIAEDGKQILGPNSICVMGDFLLALLESRPFELDEKKNPAPPSALPDLWAFNPALALIQPATGKIMKWIPLTMPAEAIACDGEKIYLAEHWTTYYDKHLKACSSRPKNPVIHVMKLKESNPDK